MRLVDPGTDFLVEEPVAGESVLEDVDLARPGESAGEGVRQVVQDGDDARHLGLAAVGVLEPDSIENKFGLSFSLKNHLRFCEMS